MADVGRDNCCEYTFNLGLFLFKGDMHLDWSLVDTLRFDFRVFVA